ncbi:type IV secretion system protein [Paracoccus sp. MBLB3053]|uniref:Type IV secretion system protein n=1 Tax=Paracoccus aurantius TaxID=3073814 RepID=A0ABU2HYX0_9RHOB|nr:type IV secretion system protein [Paracoccus sp. MBLB3053]MDS9470245.1 type IV secretion system protein [Paracoccus sp. MBLB3053]
MGLVTNIIQSLDASVKATGERFFESTASAVGPLWTIFVTLLLLLIGMNMALGIYRMSAKDSLQIVTRVVLVYMFAFSWANFGTFYDALTSASGNLALSFFDIAAGSGADINSAMDGFAADMGDTADGVMKSMGSITRGVLGALFFLILAILMAVYVLVVGFAKIMIAFLLGVAPLAMIFTIFNRTKPLFEAWLSSFVSYLMYPIAASAVIAAVVSMAGEQFQDQTQVDNLSSLVGFMVVVFVGVFALMKIPEAANHITGQMNLASIAPEAMRLAGSTLQRPSQVGANALGVHGLAHPKQYLAGLSGLPSGLTEAKSTPHQRSAREAGMALRQKLTALDLMRRN